MIEEEAGLKGKLIVASWLLPLACTLLHAESRSSESWIPCLNIHSSTGINDLSFRLSVVAHERVQRSVVCEHDVVSILYVRTSTTVRTWYCTPCGFQKEDILE
jgi:hypothetical protein